MKRMVLFFLCYPALLHGQLCYDFEDNLLLNWRQDRDSSWHLEPSGAISGALSLHHSLDDSVGNHDRIAFPLDSLFWNAPITSWKFRIKHAYYPSSANNWAVFLAADGDQQEMFPEGEINAYVLGVNFTGSDDSLRLWKKAGKQNQVLLSTTLNWQEQIGHGAAYLEVQKGEDGSWQVFRVQDSIGIWDLIGEGLDTGFLSPDYFGIYYQYSSKQDQKLWFDDLCISGHFIRDTVPPSLIKAEILDQYSIQLIFTEPINGSTCLNPENYLLSQYNRIPDSLILVSGKSCIISFADPFPAEVPLVLSITGISDLKGNNSGPLKVEFLYYKPGPHDIIINEIMFDPSPVLGLPEFEYLELYNRVSYDIDLLGWTLQSGNKTYEFPPVSLPGGQYLVLGYEGTGEQYPLADSFLGLLSSRTSLSNEGALICLYDRDNLLIDWMEYAPSMHMHDYYAKGGWSLEKVDPNRTCMDPGNWTTSKDRSGGTPGLENSVKGDNPDRQSPVIEQIYLPDSLALVIEFSEPMDPDPLLHVQNYNINPGPGNPVRITTVSPFNRTATLHFDQAFMLGKDYLMELSVNLVDCAGEAISSGRYQRIALPVQPGINEVLISEILFDAHPACPDFIEIHNPGSKTFDLADLQIGKRQTTGSQIEFISAVSREHQLFYPGDFLALSADPEKLMGCCYVHDPETLIACKGLTGLDDREGTIVILDKYLRVVDEMSYNKQMHLPLLTSKEGVSLERLSFNLPSNSPSNWLSAAATEGFSTPGRANSQSLQPGMENEGMEVDPAVFSPDQDGIEDFVMIKFDFSQPGVLATILVLDPRGRIIRKIAENQWIGAEGFFTWDGSDDQGRRARAGIYLVFASIYHAQGGVRKFKKTCVLSPGR